MLFLFAALDFNTCGLCDDVWESVPGLVGSDLDEVCIDSKGTVYAADEKVLYRKEDSGNNWAAVFSAQLNDDRINFVSAREQGIFVCTNNGVFASSDGKTAWKKIFKGMGSKENNVLHVAFSKDNRLYLSTGAGLFISSSGGLEWSKDGMGGAGLGLRWVEFLNDEIFVAAEKGVYKNSGKGWKRTFVTAREYAEYDAETADESPAAAKPVNSIAIAGDNVFLATDSGIFISGDKGETWQDFVSAGLMSLKIKRVLFKDVLCAITNKGVFIFSDKDKLWQNLYKGMDTKNIGGAAIDKENCLWAATGKGLYKTKIPSFFKPASGFSPDTGLGKEIGRILESFKNEPGIRDVQYAAIEYAEVHPDKIKHWRESARKKALLPNVSIGLDRYVTDYWHWDSGTNPDTLQKGKDAVSWDLKMAWDMSELIWNSDQTSIDTRSKLMAELRDDIMNEVTRTYFERRRLQIDLLVSPPKDFKTGLEKELRLQELTADIDALTGSYFSAHIKKE